MIRAVFFAPVLAVMLSGCIPDKLNTEPEVRGLEGAAPVQTLDNPARKTSVTLRPSGKLIVNLPANPSTGHQWVIAHGPDAYVITLTDEAYIADPAPPGLVGSGGTSRFEFTAIAAGKTRLDLSYISPGGVPVETRSLSITVLR